ncbi:hypothetical protein CC2G_012445 [Coprinopsis cinerea AmutBmut pab1-1]|nr:hypothetical protein CC2G_012445 [Coprinopsis cinerea AmutBmut pab1-1]
MVKGAARLRGVPSLSSDEESLSEVSDSDTDDVNSSSQHPLPIQPPRHPTNAALRSSNSRRHEPPSFFNSALPSNEASSRLHETESLLKATQLELGQANDELKALRTKTQQLQAELDAIKKNYRKKKRGSVASGHVEPDSTDCDDTDNGDNEDEIIASLGRQFRVTTALFLDRRWFQKKKPKINSDDPRRFQQEKYRFWCEVAELYENIPAHLHTHVAESISFEKIFISKSDSHLRHLIKKLRDGAAATAFNNHEYAEYYKAGRDRSSLAAFQKLIQWPKGAALSEYLLPIHFPGQIFNLEVAFRCECLAYLIKALIHGPSSIERPALMKKDWYPPAKSSSRHWKLEFVTPGLLGLGWILAVFLHSADEVLKPVGPTTKFPYKAAYETYKDYVMKGLADDTLKPAMEDLLAWYNQLVFPHLHRDEETVASTTKTRADELGAMLAGLRISNTRATSTASASVPSTASTPTVTPPTLPDPLSSLDAAHHTTSTPVQSSESSSSVVRGGANDEPGPHDSPVATAPLDPIPSSRRSTRNR